MRVTEMTGSAVLGVGNIGMVTGFVHRESSGGTEFNADMATFTPIRKEGHLAARPFLARWSCLGGSLLWVVGLCDSGHRNLNFKIVFWQYSFPLVEGFY
jgi:hypothetical protein